ncbi:MAG: hypothetical protein HN909_07195 [Phycisphaerales bacterium]|jgi:regulator of sigma E protease|nr:hypothetical protein [Phycisphaerales bacterium]MBT7171537.1 hypothetical protein [Phycisphaerales bacterium]
MELFASTSETLASAAGTIWAILKVLICLNFVIFTHELGHFFAARWAKVRVERFAIGVGKTLWSWKPGETEYRVGCIPIMGYVMMSGQDDFDAEGSANVADQVYPAGDFRGASVFKRFVIIAAGVTMNIITAAILFVIVGMIGVDFPASEVGAVQENMPAKTSEITWADGTTSKGIEPGDVLRSINGSRVDSFLDIKYASILADAASKEVLRVGLVRGGRKGVAKLIPVYDDGIGAPVVGLAPSFLLKVKPSSKDYTTLLKVEHKGEIIQVATTDGKHAVDTTGWHSWKFSAAYLKTHHPNLPVNGQALRVRIRRTDKDGKTVDDDVTFTPPLWSKSQRVFRKDGTFLVGKIEVFDPKEAVELDPDKNNDKDKPVKVQPKQLAVRVEGKLEIVDLKDYAGAPQRDGLDLLGMTPRRLVAGVIKGLPASVAGVEPGDVVVRYGDTQNPMVQEFFEISKAREGKATALVVIRNGKQISLSVTPKSKKGRVIIGTSNRAAMNAAPVVCGVRDGSPAAKAGVQTGWTITKIGKVDVKTWHDVYCAMVLLKQGDSTKARTAEAAVPLESMALLDPAGKIHTVKLPIVSGDYDSIEADFTREFDLEPMLKTVRFESPLVAMRWGLKQTWQQSVGMYSQLRAMIKGTVSSKNAAGIVGIVHMASGVAREGWMRLLHFMAIISVALAVFNFLPLPVVDGGHAVLLVIEGVRGKPLPEKWVTWIQRIGIYLILGLFVLLTIRDIYRIVENWIG